MCTVSLLALPHGGYLLAANRDEQITRGAAHPPAVTAAGGIRFVAPRDRDAGGTWIAVDELGRSLCLLNGDPPDPGVVEPTDAPSRGLLLLELMRAATAADVFAELAARHARGRLVSRVFKLLVVAPAAGGPRALRIAWNGRSLTRSELAAPHLETSNGFDPAGVALRRGESFRDWLASRDNAAATAEGPIDRLRSALADWHRSHLPGAPAGDLYSVCMHRTPVRTVSSTLIEVGPQRIVMRYQPGQPCAREPAVEVELR